MCHPFCNDPPGEQIKGHFYDTHTGKKWGKQPMIRVYSLSTQVCKKTAFNNSSKIKVF